MKLAMVSRPLADLPIEVARAAVFLGSDWASYITGHLMAVDGGVLMH
ncbi:MAG: SDR family oxidoreductase [Betaproteobacteria bacterium]|nr:SDR family oxidoreductase [Betaproteobacteria bacterium]